jgi:hypothetical protein
MVPFISGLSGPGVSNGRRVFALGERLGFRPNGEPNEDPAQNFVVTVNFDGRKLTSATSIATDFDLYPRGWRLVGVVVDEDDDGNLVLV